jgi:hypothetical protein
MAPNKEPPRPGFWLVKGGFGHGASDRDRTGITSLEGRARRASTAISDCEKCPEDTAEHRPSPCLMAR